MDSIAIVHHDPAMDLETRTALIAHYKAGYDVVVAALDGVKADEIDRRPAADAWTAREVAHHLADSETNSYIRLRKLLAEEAPVIVGYDEVHWTKTLHYDRPYEASLAVFKAVRASSAELLHLMTEDDWARSGTHSESGPYSTELWLELYAPHAHDHADQIRRARRGEV